ncbi:hypothetical protein F7725_012598 [Dissostichus mawsoni]|uniref:Dynein heavy chain tail domain-containing protein n=1 Tax=Dissostichus mawsoni TaxID=36200 RepID=A0A7J5YMT8_DISMA|nr:hypothetical protein F7725_012598 [Dissostichus mawsoni]
MVKYDDLRVEWIRQCVTAGFVLPENPNPFDELLGRGDGEEEEDILRFLDFVSDENSPSCLLFFKTVREEEIEVNIPLDEIVLHIPELDLEPTVNVLLSDPEMVEKLEQCLMNWQTKIMLLWRNNKTKSHSIVQTLEGAVAALTKYRMEADDNFRFLATLKRNFMVLDLWKSSYFEVRAEIEESGRNQRWEFDRKKLFERTDYIASICQDLLNVLQILEEFYNIFGPELKGVPVTQNASMKCCAEWMG